MNQEAPTTYTEEEVAMMDPIDQLLVRMVKTEHVQEFLEQILNLITHDRAHQKLNFKPEALYEAAAASGFSLGQLNLIHRMVSLGHVVPNPT